MWLQDSNFIDWKPDRLCDISTKSIVIPHLTEDRDHLFPSGFHNASKVGTVSNPPKLPLLKPPLMLAPWEALETRLAAQLLPPPSMMPQQVKSQVQVMKMKVRCRRHKGGEKRRWTKSKKVKIIHSLGWIKFLSTTHHHSTPPLNFNRSTWGKPLWCNKLFQVGMWHENTPLHASSFLESCGCRCDSMSRMEYPRPNKVKTTSAMRKL